MGITQYPAHSVRAFDGRGVIAYDYGMKTTASAAQNANALQAAMQAAYDSKRPVVYVPDGLYSFAADILQPVRGVHVYGAMPRQVYPTNQPDLQWSMDGGTILEGPGSGTLIHYQGAGGAAGDWSARSIGNTGLHQLGIRGYDKGVSYGGTTQQGVHFSTFEDLYFTDITDTAIEYINGQRLNAARVYGYIAGNGLRVVNDIDLVTYGSVGPDSLYDMTFAVSSPNSYCFSFESKTAGSSSNLNAINAEQLIGLALQGRSANSQTATITSGNANIAVTDTSKYPVGMPVMFTTTTGTNLILNRVYFVLSRSTSSGAGNITLSARFNGSVITPDGSGTPLLKCNGQAIMRMIGWSSSGSDKLTNLHMRALDMEGYSTCAVVMQDVQRSTLEFMEVANVNNSLLAGCMKSSIYNQVWSSSSNTWDVDSASAGVDGTRLLGRKTTPLVGAVQTEPQSSPTGWWYDMLAQQGTLQLTNSAALKFANNGGIRPTAALGQYNFGRTVSTSIASSQLGILTFSGAAGQTFTLPSIVGSAFLTHNVGLPSLFFNASANTVVLQTDGTQTFNGLAGKTSMTVPANSAVLLFATSTQNSTSLVAGTYYWTVFALASGEMVKQLTDHSTPASMLTDSQSTIGAAGGASALPATPVGYTTVRVGGNEYAVPYYNK